MANGVKKDEAAAGMGDISNQPDEVGFREMVRHADRDRNLGTRQRAGDRIAGEDRDRCIGRGRTQIESDDLRAELPTNLLEKSAVAATDVQHTVDRNRIAAKHP